MTKLLDVTFSTQVSQQINSKAQNPFDNAFKAAVLSEGSVYVQGFLVKAEAPYLPLEHCWIEVGDRIVDPTFPHLNKNPEELYYFPAQSLNVKQLQAAVEEATEDYPEDDPLPIYGAAPYEYYGDVMLGGADYLEAYKLAEAKCRELSTTKPDAN